MNHLTPLAAPLTTVDRGLAADAYAFDHLPAVSWIGPLEQARASLATELRKVGGPVLTAAAAATIAPDLLGATRPHRYLVVFEQPSETRPDGGLLGGWAVLTADDGALSVSSFGPNSALPPVSVTRLSQLDPDLRTADGPGAQGRTGWRPTCRPASARKHWPGARWPP